MNILVIGDTHLPFENKGYLDFCLDIKKKYKCKDVVHIGDLVDNHAISQHDHDPDGFSPYGELQESLKRLKLWYKAFPRLVCLQGNHDERLERAACHYGLSRSYFRAFKELLEMPKEWEYKFDHYQYGVRFFHGMGYSGPLAHVNAMKESSSSIVMGHLHSNAGVSWMANESQVKFGLAVGCGIDRHTYAFNYGRDHRRKPIIGCGVVLESGKHGLFVPMKLM